MNRYPEDRLETRPRPLVTAANRTTAIVGTLSALVAALSGAGISLLTAEQAGAATALLAAVPGVVTLVGAALAAFGVVKRGEPKVTPISDPQDNQGNKLVLAA